MSKVLFEGNKRVSRRTLLKGMGLAAGTLALGRFGTLGQGQILIGAVIPLSGALASFGPRFLVAAQIALDEVNGAGGVLGKRVELVTGDSGTNPNTGGAASS